MARTTKALTDTQIRQAKPKIKDYKLFDGGGLFLLVTKSGGKHWKLKYKFDGKEKKLSLGTYPTVTLSEARILKEQYKQNITNKINPSDIKKQDKEIQLQETESKTNTFKLIALERLEKIKDDISEGHYKRSCNSLKNDVYPCIGNIPIDEIIASDIINIFIPLYTTNI